MSETDKDRTLFAPGIHSENSTFSVPEIQDLRDRVRSLTDVAEFSTVGFRFGHSLLSSDIGRDQNNGTGITDATGDSGVNLTEDFFDPYLISATPGIDPLTGHTTSNIGAILKADADGTANELDLLLIDEVRNTLFGIPHGPGTDLAARG